MYLAFIDESGNIHPNDPQNNNYILTVVVMHEKGMKFLHRESQELKKKIWQLVQGEKKSMPITFEVHMQEIKDAKGYFKPLRGENAKTEQVLSSIYEFISTLYITIITVVIIKDEFLKKYPQEDLLKWALRLLIERINSYVRKDSQYQKEFALLIMDIDFTHDKEKRTFISEMMEFGIKYNTRDVDRILDTPIFLKSELHNGIQIVDSVAYLIGRYTRKVLDGTTSILFDKLSNKFLFKLTSRFYGEPSSIEDKGIKFFPSNYRPPPNYWDVFKI